MTYLLEKKNIKQFSNLSTTLETIQDDLMRSSQFVTQLSGLTDEQLAACDITDQLDSIHRCLSRFEARCMTIQLVTYVDEFSQPVNEETYEVAFPDKQQLDRCPTRSKTR